MKNSSHFDIAIGSIKCFTDDGVLDIGELNYLLGLAMRDGVMDSEEKRVLSNIFSKVPQHEVSYAVWDRMQEIKREHNF